MYSKALAMKAKKKKSSTWPTKGGSIEPSNLCGVCACGSSSVQFFFLHYDFYQTNYMRSLTFFPFVLFFSIPTGVQVKITVSARHDPKLRSLSNAPLVAHCSLEDGGRNAEALQYRWTRQGAEVLESKWSEEKVLAFGSTLVTAPGRNAETYMCFVVYRLHGNAASKQKCVTVSPQPRGQARPVNLGVEMVSSRPTDLVALGESVTLFCKAKDPMVNRQIYWYYNGKPCSPSALKSLGVMSNRVGLLMIKSVSSNHVGKWSCKMATGEKASRQITVREPGE